MIETERRAAEQKRAALGDVEGGVAATAHAGLHLATSAQLGARPTRGREAEVANEIAEIIKRREGLQVTTDGRRRPNTWVTILSTRTPDPTSDPRI